MAGRLLTLVSLFLLSVLPKVVLSTPCVAFDINWNLLVFGLDGKDYNASTQNTWTGSSQAVEITAPGRPPFDGNATTCYLAQFYNAIYVTGGNSSSPSDIFIFDASTKVWSTQKVTTVGVFDPSNFNAILDHDTNVFYAISNGELFFLNMEAEVTANSTALTWVDVEKVPFTTTGYQPVMALAQNHIHFLDVPGDSAGEAQIFVIHFSFFQPQGQSYPVNGGGTIPATHGQTTSIFQPAGDGVQQEFAFIPDDGSATYVINVETNTTQSLAGPAIKDAGSTYFASDTAIVQLTSAGEVSYLAYQEGQDSTNAQAQWTKVSPILAVAPPSSSSGSATSTGSGSSTKTSSGASSTSTGGSGKASGAMEGRSIAGGLLSAAAVIVAAVLLL